MLGGGIRDWECEGGRGRGEGRVRSTERGARFRSRNSSLQTSYSVPRTPCFVLLPVACPLNRVNWRTGRKSHLSRRRPNDETVEDQPAGPYQLYTELERIAVGPAEPVHVSMRPQAFSDEYKVDNDSRDGQRDARSLAQENQSVAAEPAEGDPDDETIVIEEGCWCVHENVTGPPVKHFLTADKQSEEARQGVKKQYRPN